MIVNERLGYLDSIRGIAALCVVSFHCWLINLWPDRHVRGLAGGLTSFSDLFQRLLSKTHEAAHSGVLIFFVLSGFVLALSLEKKPMPYIGFIIKRLFRIYPLFLFVILATFALHRLIGVQHDTASEFLVSINTAKASYHDLMKHLAMLGTKNSMDLDGVMWTLMHEIRISLIFPLILLSVKKYRWWGILGYLLLSVACDTWPYYAANAITPEMRFETVGRTFLDTGVLIIFFAVGAFMALERVKLASAIANLSTGMKIFLFLIVSYSLLKSDFSDDTLVLSKVYYLHGAGALGLIALALGVKKFERALSHRVLIWLGRISYGLYLVHWPTIYVLNQTIGASWSVLQLSLAVIAVSLFLAHVLAHIIEYPGIKLGKRLSIKLLTSEASLQKA